MGFWEEKRIIVTGGAGFVGRYVVEKLRQRGARHIFVPRSRDYDLREKEAVIRLFRDAQPHLVIHLAATLSSAKATLRHPGRSFYDNAIMGLYLLEQARLFGVEKFVIVGTAYAYPKFNPVPFKEEDFWKGYPEEGKAPYVLAKKMLLTQAQAYRQEYGLNAIYLLPASLYGPGDNFEPEAASIIPTLIRLFVDAVEEGEEVVVVRGSSSASREFLYVEDGAEAIVLAAEHYNKPEPVNIGSGQEITIRELAQLIAELTGFRGRILWETTLPDIQPRCCLDTSRAKAEFGFQARVPLREGLARSIAWYRSIRPKAGGAAARGSAGPPAQR